MTASSQTSPSAPLECLRKFRTPTVYDAIERFGVRSKTEGYTDSTVRSILPSVGILVGHAVTARIVAEFPLQDNENSLTFRDVWEHFSKAGSGSIAVVQDLDFPAGRASVWGDVSVAIYKRFGCVGVLTNGSVRDVPDIAGMDFGLFASGVSVGHGNVRYVAVDIPVKVGGLVINPGDWLHMDEHGALLIPKELNPQDIARVAEELLAQEAHVKHYISQSDFDFTKLDELHASSMGDEH
jgi:4-hydroxy-4-methyl-2-oxoglutarate aldolase